MYQSLKKSSSVVPGPLLFVDVPAGMSNARG